MSTDRIITERVVSAMFDQNAYLVWKHGETKAVAIDPGFDVESLISLIHSNQLTLAAIWLTHGHHQRVKWDLKTIAAAGKSLAANIIVFGHTHEATIEYISSVILINPGAAMPWEGGGYAVLDIDEQGKISAELKQL